MVVSEGLGSAAEDAESEADEPQPLNIVNWWRAELPTPQELDACRENLRASGGGAVDYILTHEAPGKVLDFLGLQGLQRNWLHSFLDELNEKTAHKRWLFGRYHDNKAIDEKHILLWEQIVRVI